MLASRPPYWRPQTWRKSQNKFRPSKPRKTARPNVPPRQPRQSPRWFRSTKTGQPAEGGHRRRAVSARRGYPCGPYSGGPFANRTRRKAQDRTGQYYAARESRQHPLNHHSATNCEGDRPQVDHHFHPPRMSPCQCVSRRRHKRRHRLQRATARFARLPLRPSTSLRASLPTFNLISGASRVASSCVGYALYTARERPLFFNPSISTGKNFFRLRLADGLHSRRVGT
jgi:hypothetical protein